MRSISGKSLWKGCGENLSSERFPHGQRLISSNQDADRSVQLYTFNVYNYPATHKTKAFFAGFVLSRQVGNLVRWGQKHLASENQTGHNTAFAVNMNGGESCEFVENH